MENKKLQDEIQKKFLIRKINKPIKPVTAGNINSTYRVEAEGANYLLQKINTYVFTKPEEVMQNIRRVSRWHEKKVLEEGGNPEREILYPINTLDGTRYLIDDKGQYWRMYRWIEGAKTYNSIGEAKKIDNIDERVIFKKVGMAFGKFEKRFADYPTKDPKMELHETIQDFHNTPKRFSDFELAIEADRIGRIVAVKDDEHHPLNEAIKKIKSYKKEMRLLELGKLSGKLPIRVIHGDPKINNIMIDEETGDPICIIDLDTVGLDTALGDYGDAIRSGANKAGEEPEDINEAVMDMELFKAFNEGYLEETLLVDENEEINNDPKKGLTKLEIALLYKAPKILTLELAMRFITDYINGDEYFKLKDNQSEDFNLKRGLVQLHLAEDMNAKEVEMREIINTIINEKNKKLKTDKKGHEDNKCER